MSRTLRYNERALQNSFARVVLTYRVETRLEQLTKIVTGCKNYDHNCNYENKVFLKVKLKRCNWS